MFTVEAAVSGKAETVAKIAFRLGWIEERAVCNDWRSGPKDVFSRELTFELTELMMLPTTFVILARALWTKFTRALTTPPTTSLIPSKRPAEPYWLPKIIIFVDCFFTSKDLPQQLVGRQ